MYIVLNVIPGFIESFSDQKIFIIDKLFFFSKDFTLPCVLNILTESLRNQKILLRSILWNKIRVWYPYTHPSDI